MKLNYYDAMREYGGVSLAPPVIIPSIPATVIVPANVPLNATVATQPPNQSCTYQWSIDSVQEDAKVNNPGTKLAGFNSAGLQAEQLSISITVTDENGLSSKATQTVDVQRLAITRFELPVTLESGVAFTPLIEVDSPNGPVTYGWDLPPGFEIDDTNPAAPVITAGPVSLDTNFTISCMVTDSEGVVEQVSATLNVLKTFFVTADIIDTLHFTLIHDSNIQAYPGTLNREVFKFQLDEDDLSRADPRLVDENRMLILQLPGIEGFEVRSGTRKIETNADNTGPLRISRVNELHARTGDLVSTDKLGLGNQGSLELAFILNLADETSGFLLTASKSIPTAPAKSHQIPGAIIE